MSFTPFEITDEVREKSRAEAKKVKEDFLNVDTPIPGQSFSCISFLSPEKVLKERYLWYLTRFLQGMAKQLPPPVVTDDTEYKTEHSDIMNNIRVFPDEPDEDEVKKGLSLLKRLRDLKKPDYTDENAYKSQLHHLLTTKFGYDKVKDLWEDFQFVNHDKLAQEYDEKTDFQTSTRGVKFRGTYSNFKEAKARADQLAKLDDGHHVFVGQVGYWLPWDPQANQMENQEYQEGELNTLMKKYKENLDATNQHYEQRKQAKVKAAQKEALKARKKREKEERRARRAKRKAEKAAKAAKREQETEESETVKSVEDTNEKIKIEIVSESEEESESEKESEESSESESESESEDEAEVKRREEDKKKISKVRGIAKKKDEIMFKAMEAQKKARELAEKNALMEAANKAKPTFNPTPDGVDASADQDNAQENAQNQEAVAAVFSQEDPWMKRKQEQAKEKAKPKKKAKKKRAKKKK